MFVRATIALLLLSPFCLSAGPGTAPEESGQALLKTIEADPGSDAGFEAISKLMNRLAAHGAMKDGVFTYPPADAAQMRRLLDLVMKYHFNRTEASNTALIYLFSRPLAERTDYLRRLYETSTSEQMHQYIAGSLLNFYEDRYHDRQTPAAERAQVRKEVTSFVALLHRDLKDGYMLDRADKAVIALDYSIGNKLPALHVKTVDGGTADVAQQRGKIVIVDLWATWCPPCVAGQPALVELKKEFAGKPFEVFSLSMDKKPEDVLKHMKKQPMPWVNGYVGFQPPLVRELGISGFPGVFVLDTDGVIRIRTSELDDQAKDYIRELVAEAQAKKSG